MLGRDPLTWQQARTQPAQWLSLAKEQLTRIRYGDKLAIVSLLIHRLALGANCLSAGAPVAGTGISVSGQTVSLDIASLTNMAATVATNDTIPIYDVSATALLEATTEQIVSGVMLGATALGATPASDDTFIISDTSNSGAVRRITMAELSGSVGQRIETKTLTAGEVTARSFTMSAAVTSAANTFVSALGGIMYHHSETSP